MIYYFCMIPTNPPFQNFSLRQLGKDVVITNNLSINSSVMFLESGVVMIKAKTSTIDDIITVNVSGLDTGGTPITDFFKLYVGADEVFGNRYFSKIDNIDFTYFGSGQPVLTQIGFIENIKAIQGGFSGVSQPSTTIQVNSAGTYPVNISPLFQSARNVAVILRDYSVLNPNGGNLIVDVSYKDASHTQKSHNVAISNDASLNQNSTFTFFINDVVSEVTSVYAFAPAGLQQAFSIEIVPLDYDGFLLYETNKVSVINFEESYNCAIANPILNEVMGSCLATYYVKFDTQDIYTSALFVYKREQNTFINLDVRSGGTSFIGVAGSRDLLNVYPKIENNFSIELVENGNSTVGSSEMCFYKLKPAIPQHFCTKITDNETQKYCFVITQNETQYFCTEWFDITNEDMCNIVKSEIANSGTSTLLEKHTIDSLNAKYTISQI